MAVKKKAATTERKGDIFKLFEAINRGDYDYIDALTDEEVKAFSPVVLLMWMHGATSNPETHVTYTNEYVNPFVFSLQKHPRLLLKLFVAANSGMGNTRYKFVKSTTKNDSLIYRHIAKHYECGYDQAKEIKELLSDDDIKELTEIYGDQLK